jgi:hypothetical protein
VNLVSSFPDMDFMADPCLSPDGTTLFFNSLGKSESNGTAGALKKRRVFDCFETPLKTA